MNIKRMTLMLAMCAFIHCLYAQRHYAGVSALELNYGQNIFGSNDHNASLSFSKYRNRTTYWKIGLNYFEKSFDHGYEDLSLEVPEFKTIGRLARDYYIDASFFKTVATNMSSLYFNLGVGLFTGVESYKELEEKYEYEYLVGPKIDAELELFVSSRFAFLGRVMQYWNPFSKGAWNTTWNVGVKVLLY